MKLINGNCLEVLKNFESNSIDAIVTDPPYGLSFMGKKWDYDVPSQEIWEECLRVLKPGGYLLAFAGTRTQHRMAVRIEDAGFEIRDMIAWVYGSGFPKSLNIGKAVDKIQGNEREDLGWHSAHINRPETENWNKSATEMNHGKFKVEGKQGGGLQHITKGTSEWEGWGTALKPALEPITVARKPLEGNVAQNCLKWGVGGIAIDACRIGIEIMPSLKVNTGFDKVKGFGKGSTSKSATNKVIMSNSATGRFPANLIHDGSDEVVELFPQTKSGGGNKIPKKDDIMFGACRNNIRDEKFMDTKPDSGSAARFFYCAKASKSERNRGCEDMETSQKFTAGNYSQSPTCKDCNLTLNGTNDHSKCSGEVYYKEMESKNTKNNHPTVKPIALMEYLVKLVSKEGHTVIDPFMGSGSTGIACKKLNRNFIGIELDADYCKIAEARINAVKSIQNNLF